MPNRDVSLQDLERCLQEAQRSGRSHLRGLPKAVAEDVVDWFQAHGHPCEISYQGAEGFDITVLPSAQNETRAKADGAAALQSEPVPFEGTAGKRGGPHWEAAARRSRA
jgi:hypothetical protein